MFAPQNPPTLPVEDDRFRRLVESIEDYAIYMLDCGGHVMTWNRGSEINKGYSAEQVLGKHFRIFFVPEDVQSEAPEAELAAATKDGRTSSEGWRIRQNGQRFWASFTLTAIRDEAGKHLGFAKVTRDLTQQKGARDALVAMEASLRLERDALYAATESSLDAFYICEAVRDEDGTIRDFVYTFLNSNVEKMVLIPRSELLGGRMNQLFPSKQSARFFEVYKQVVQTGSSQTVELSTDEASVSSPWVRVQVVKLRDGVAITASDITQRKLDEVKTVHLAQHDHLTGLPNRTMLNDRVQQACALSSRDKKLTGVLMVDLDNFKHINDTLGHAAGDDVLRETARRLTRAVRAVDSVIRLGGDEFVIVCADVTDVSDLEKIAGKVNVALAEQFPNLPQGLLVTCSLGIAASDWQQPTEELLAQADSAMYTAKQRGKNQFDVYVRPAITPPSYSVKSKDPDGLLSNLVSA